MITDMLKKIETEINKQQRSRALRGYWFEYEVNKETGLLDMVSFNVEEGRDIQSEGFVLEFPEAIGEIKLNSSDIAMKLQQSNKGKCHMTIERLVLPKGRTDILQQFHVFGANQEETFVRVLEDNPQRRGNLVALNLLPNVKQIVVKNEIDYQKLVSSPIISGIPLYLEVDGVTKKEISMKQRIENLGWYLDVVLVVASLPEVSQTMSFYTDTTDMVHRIGEMVVESEELLRERAKALTVSNLSENTNFKEQFYQELILKYCEKYRYTRQYNDYKQLFETNGYSTNHKNTELYTWNKKMSYLLPVPTHKQGSTTEKRLKLEVLVPALPYGEMWRTGESLNEWYDAYTSSWVSNLELFGGKLGVDIVELLEESTSNVMEKLLLYAQWNSFLSRVLKDFYGTDVQKNCDVLSEGITGGIRVRLRKSFEAAIRLQVEIIEKLGGGMGFNTSYNLLNMTMFYWSNPLEKAERDKGVYAPKYAIKKLVYFLEHITKQYVTHRGMSASEVKLRTWGTGEGSTGLNWFFHKALNYSKYIRMFYGATIDIQENSSDEGWYDRLWWLFECYDVIKDKYVETIRNASDSYIFSLLAVDGRKKPYIDMYELGKCLEQEDIRVEIRTLLEPIFSLEAYRLAQILYQEGVQSDKIIWIDMNKWLVSWGITFKSLESSTAEEIKAALKARSIEELKQYKVEADCCNFYTG